MSRWVLILAGGVGSRFWPLSTPTRPKQLLPLVGEESLLAQTISRMSALADADHTLILANESLVGPISAALPRFPRANIIAEPRAAGTAAALTWGASEVARRDPEKPVMFCVHSDAAIGSESEFTSTLERAAGAAVRQRALVTVGIVPDRPDTGFGYIQPGDEVSDGVMRVRRFVEKPADDEARAMVDAGYLWNSGIFVWCAEDFLAEVRSRTPEVSAALAAHAGPVGDIAAFFSAVKPVSVDVGVLERSSNVLVVAGQFPWDDVGTWGALKRARKADTTGNVVQGEAHVVESSGSVVHAEGNTVILFGVNDLVVVTRGRLTLVTTIEKSAQLKSLLDQLPQNVQDLE